MNKTQLTALNGVRKIAVWGLLSGFVLFLSSFFVSGVNQDYLLFIGLGMIQSFMLIFGFGLFLTLIDDLGNQKPKIRITPKMTRRLYLVKK